MTETEVAARPRPSAFQRLSDREAARIRQAFLDDQHGGGTVRGWRTTAALILATLVLLGYLLTCLLGIWAAWAAWQASHINVILASSWGFLALLCLCFGWLARPRFGAGAAQGVTAQQAPELYALIAEVAARLDAPVPRTVRLDGQVNASVTREGFPPHFSLTLGLPLMFALHPQERLDLIAHELAHEVNGDPARGQWLGAALRVLHTLEFSLRPEEYVEGFGVLVNMLRWVVVLPVQGTIWLLDALLGEESQRAEFRADLMAAKLSGSEAAATTLDKLHFAYLLEFALQKQRVRPERPHAFLELRHAWDGLTPQQRGRQRQQAQQERLRLDSSHPPTSDRTDVIRHHSLPATLQLSEERARRIDMELTPFVADIQAEAYEQYRERYSGG